MPRPAFTVVSSTVAALVLLGFASRLMRHHIPGPPENELGREESEFLSRAATQMVSWKKPIPASFAAARRRDRPILLFIGNTYNPLARGFDQGIQLSTRVQSFLSRNFECIRADHLAFPMFRNAFLPISRGFANLQPGCQLWVLDPSGKIVDLLPSNLGLNPTNEGAFIDALVEARQKFESFGKVQGQDRFETAQQKDIQALSEITPPIVPPFEEYSSAVKAAIYARGGFGKISPRLLTPEPWRYLLATGSVEEAERSLMPVLQSPMVDLIDGGFFHGSRDEDWIEVEYDKSATANAAMLRVLISAYAVTKKPVYLYLAERTFDSLATEFPTQLGFAAARPSEAANGQRSDRASFGVRKLREALPEGVDHLYAQSKLGMRVETNPQMNPRLFSLSALNDRAMLKSVLDKLRKATAPPPECGSAGFADVTGFSVARMLEAARILGDPVRMDRASELFQLVEAARTGSDVIHSSHQEWQSAYLGDYLAYADAALEYYLATGRYSSILRGKDVLLQALNLFANANLTRIALGPLPTSPMPLSLAAPEIADLGFESTVAQAIRLCHRYGNVFSSEPRFRRFANGATGSFGGIANVLELRSSSFFCSAQEVFEDAFFVTVGKDAQQMSDQLAKSQPFRLSLAAFGEIRVDIQAMGAGVYVVRGGQVLGPLSVGQALKAISPFLGQSN